MRRLSLCIVNKLQNILSYSHYNETRHFNMFAYTSSIEIIMIIEYIYMYCIHNATLKKQEI